MLLSKFGYSDACVRTDIIEEPTKCVKTYLHWFSSYWLINLSAWHVVLITLVDMCMQYAAVIKEQLTAKNSLLCNYIIVGE